MLAFKAANIQTGVNISKILKARGAHSATVHKASWMRRVPIWHSATPTDLLFQKPISFQDRKFSLSTNSN